MSVSVERRKVRFASGGTECAAWHYPGSNGGCVIMAGGFAVTKEPGTDRFARRFHEAGFSVLAFDYRGLGESGGEPRQVIRLRDELADWQAAIGCAEALPEVDPERIAIWGFSLSGGHVVRVAARNPRLAAAIAQMPAADGRAGVLAASRHQKPLAMLRLTGRGVLDALGGLVGRRPLLVPLVGPPGTVALLTTPDSQEGGAVLNPDDRYPLWRQEVAARSALGVGFYRPVRDAGRIWFPLQVIVCDEDRTAPAQSGLDLAARAPRSELVRVPGGHYAPFTAAHDHTVSAELSFLRHHLLPPADGKATAPAGATVPGGAAVPAETSTPATALPHPS